MIKLEVGVSDKIPALSISPAYFTANLLNGGNDIIFLFFSECMCNYCHTPVTPCHPRQGRRGGDDEEGRGRHVVGSSGSPRFRKEGRRIKRRRGKNKKAC